MIRTGLHRLIAIVPLTAVLVVVGATWANADDGGETLDSVFFEVQDSAGNPAGRYLDLSLDGGGLNLIQQVSVLLLELQWALYMVVATISIWMMDWVLQLEWSLIFSVPLTLIATVFSDLISAIGLLSLMLIILACVVAYWIMRGRYGGAIGELAAGLIIAALAAGLLANPMGLIRGDSLLGTGGLLGAAEQAGRELAVAITVESAEELDNEEALNGLTASLTDTLIRSPHQLVNYNQIIDGTACEDVYNEVLGQDDARDALADCNETLGEAAENVGPMRVMNTLSLQGVLLAWAVMALVITLFAWYAVALVAWSGVKLVWDLVVGVVPGPGRGSLVKSGANLMFGLCMLVLSIAFIAAWMKVIQEMLAQDYPIPLMMRYWIMTLLIWVGVIMLFVFRRRLSKVMQNAAQKLASMGPGNSKPSPRPQRAKVAAGVAGGMLLASRMGLLPRLPGGGATGAAAGLARRMLRGRSDGPTAALSKPISGGSTPVGSTPVLSRPAAARDSAPAAAVAAPAPASAGTATEVLPATGPTAPVAARARTSSTPAERLTTRLGRGRAATAPASGGRSHSRLARAAGKTVPLLLTAAQFVPLPAVSGVATAAKTGLGVAKAGKVATTVTRASKTVGAASAARQATNFRTPRTVAVREQLRNANGPSQSTRAPAPIPRPERAAPPVRPAAPAPASVSPSAAARLREALASSRGGWR